MGVQHNIFDSVRQFFVRKAFLLFKFIEFIKLLRYLTIILFSENTTFLFIEKLGLTG
jgi:hypothetical protein